MEHGNRLHVCVMPVNSLKQTLITTGGLFFFVDNVTL